MARAEQKPGRRRAEPPPKRRAERSHKKPGKQPSEQPSKQPRKQPSKQPRGLRSGRRGLGRHVAPTLWFLLVAAGIGAVVLPWTPVEVPESVPLAGAVTITTLFTFGLAVRAGGRPWIAGGLAAVLAGAAVVTQVDVLLAGAAVATAVVAAVLGVLATTPAARFPFVVREVVLAAAVAAVGAFAAHAYGPEVSLERTSYLAIGFSLLGALVLVYRLGAGLQGLGRRGAVMIVSGVVLLSVTLAYTEALTHWGSPGLIDSIEETTDRIRDVLGAVPRPIEVLLGFPALAWGVSTRARRRQGWWVSAFGAPGLSIVAVSLLDPDATLAETGLSLLYSLVLGLLVGYLVIRADLFLTGARGRRARRLEELAAHRPEPGRLQPLL